jgi:hypothetical protein
MPHLGEHHILQLLINLLSYPEQEERIPVIDK